MTARATREAYPVALIELADNGADIVALDADLSVSTLGYEFGQKYPKRWMTVGVAEANMVDIAAGFAAAGKVPFIASFAVFLPGRCFDQLRTSVAQPKGGLPVKCVASHGGVTVGEDGQSAEALEDLSLVTSLFPFEPLRHPLRRSDLSIREAASQATGPTGPAATASADSVRGNADPVHGSATSADTPIDPAPALRIPTDPGQAGPGNLAPAVFTG